VTRFELSYDRFLSGRELYAVWDGDGGLQVGDVDTDSRSADGGPRIKMSPIVRRHRRASPDDVASLLGYVTRNGEVLDSGHRDVVLAALLDALRDTPSDDYPRHEGRI
jgi:hypothetical protein